MEQKHGKTCALMEKVEKLEKLKNEHGWKSWAIL